MDKRVADVGYSSNPSLVPPRDPKANRKPDARNAESVASQRDLFAYLADEGDENSEGPDTDYAKAKIARELLCIVNGVSLQESLWYWIVVMVS